jgi:putative hemolysin
MTPRTDVDWIDLADDEAVTRDIVLKSPYSRLSVADRDPDNMLSVADRDPDNIVGAV